MDSIGTVHDPAAPAPPPAKIRPFNNATDLKVVRYLVGASIMEPSSLANQAALLTPTVIFVWAVITHLAITRFSPGYPSSLVNLVAGHANTVDKTLASHIYEWLTIAPILVAPPIALLAFFELRHRNLFEDEMRNVIGQQDMRDIEEYYSVDQADADQQTPTALPQGFWVLEYDERIIGAISLDGRKPGRQLSSIVDTIDSIAAQGADSAQDQGTALASGVAKSDSKQLRSRNKQRARSKALDDDSGSAFPEGTVQIRRLATSISFRPADIEDDLLEYVARYAFKSSKVKSIVVQLRPSIEGRLQRRLKKNGFTLLPKGDKREVETRKPVEEGLWQTVDQLWPLSLDQRTMVLERAAWEKKQQQQS
ncbi:hypothetical protein OIV83_000884 [Microbotryomycetes sp. JL201]|nr:hypothetical protein OIV83_000884 [Microbotryomycetes sp. JL201]